MRRLEPIFGLEAPILFAHRGGVLEQPESTAMAFDWALNKAKAEVLELDVQLTKDGQFVVWHGPGLSNVRILGESDRPKDRKRNEIHKFNWSELEGQAWVGGPEFKTMDEDDIDLSKVDQNPECRLMLLTEFLQRYQETPLNIEMKETFKHKINDTDRKGLEHNVEAFVDILKEWQRGRAMVVVSASGSTIKAFREISGERFPTGLSAWEQLLLLITGMKMRNRALETTHDISMSNAQVVKRVARAGGSTFVFLTAIPGIFPALDDEVPEDEDIYEILNRGVDGIMTDRPREVRRIMDQWIQKHPDG